MRTFLSQFLASLLALALVAGVGFFALLVLVGVATQSKKPRIPAQATLHLTIPAVLPEYPTGGTRPWEERPATLHDLRQSLRMAAVDDRIERVVLDIGVTEAGWASLEELRSWIADVRAAKKPVFAYLQQLDFRNYYLASAADSIWMPPDALVFFAGIHSQRFYVKSSLDKLGVRPKLHRIEKYKAAAELTTRTDMSPEARENARWILDEQFATVRQAMSHDRRMPVARLDSLLAVVSPSPEEATRAGLIDRIVYWSEIQDRFEGPDAEKGRSRIVRGSRYAQLDPKSVGLRGPKRVAVIHAQGTIAGSKSSSNPFLGLLMGSDTINRELRRADEDDRVDAIVFRIDSPGGSSYTSDLIKYQLALVQKHKPVVVSMGDVAASGGYKIAFPCSILVANPSTRTGSIGSIFSLMNLKGLYDKIGITKDGLKYGPFADLTSDVRDWTPEERALIEARHWQSYNRWIAEIAVARHMTFERIDSLGRGRVWTGRQAMERGLVDSLGTLDDAIAIAARRAGGRAGDKVTETHWPKPKSFQEALLGGDWALVRQMLAEALWHEAAEPFRQSIEILGDPDIRAIDEPLVGGL